MVHLAFLIFVAGIEVGFLQICLALYDGGEPTFADTFTPLALGPKCLAGQMLYLLMVVIGLLLLVVPGVYLSVRYALFGFCMVAGVYARYRPSPPAVLRQFVCELLAQWQGAAGVQ